MPERERWRAGFAGQKESSLREKKPKRWRNDPHPGGIVPTSREFHRAGITPQRNRLRPRGISFAFHGVNISQGKQINADERQEKFRDKLFELAIDDFRLNLEKLRKLYPVNTICMHGSPLSKWDNRELWKKYDYRDYGIIAEPYFDVDFGEVFYLTDTGRSWNNSNASVRDKVNSKFDITIKDTSHLIEKIQNNELPDKIMLNTHPQRWDDRFGPWVKELVWQNIKNMVKKWVVSRKGAKPQRRA